MENTIIGALDEHPRRDLCSGTPADSTELNVRLLAKTAKTFDRIRCI